MCKELLKFINGNFFSTMLGTFIGAILSLLFTFILNKQSKKMNLRVAVWNSISFQLNELDDKITEFQTKIELIDSVSELRIPYQKFISDILKNVFKIESVVRSYILAFPELDIDSAFSDTLKKSVIRNHNSKEEFENEVEQILQCYVDLSVGLQKVLLEDFFGRRQRKMIKDMYGDIGEM